MPNKPIGPDDTYDLRTAYNDGVTRALRDGFEATSHWNGLESVAAAVVPEGYVIVRRSALRAVLERVPQAQRYIPFDELADLIAEDV